MTCDAIWHGCYHKDYDLQTPESMSHPAKMDWTLCLRILTHLRELGLLKEGDTVFDPMAGTGRTALAACSLGYRAVTLELEERFIGFQKANLEYASRKLGRQLDWTIFQGDARKLSEILKDRGLVTVTSPPYEDAVHESGIDNARFVRPGGPNSQGLLGRYGTSPGQIGNRKDRPLKAVMSPPYGEAQTGGGIGAAHIGKGEYTVTTKMPKNIYQPGEHGTSEGQIGNLPDRPLKCLTSPPYEQSQGRRNDPVAGAKAMPYGYWDRTHGMGHLAASDYGQAEGNIAHDKIDYLSAMKIVYEQIAKVADVLTVVTKNPTRNGQLRNLALDTFLLLKSCHSVLYCHCAPRDTQEVSLDDTEWQIYQTLLQQGPPLLDVRCTHRKQVEDREMPQAQSEGYATQTTFGGNEGEIKSQKSQPSIQRREQSKTQGGDGQIRATTAETEAVMPDMREGSESGIYQVLSSSFDIGRSAPENGRNSLNTDEEISRAGPTPFPADQLGEKWVTESNVARRYKKEFPLSEWKSELAKSQDDSISSRQFHVSGLREGSLCSGAQDSVGWRDNGVQGRGIGNALSQSSSANGRTTSLCGICGKEKRDVADQIGWRVVCHHKAMLFEEQETADLFGANYKRPKGRLSFFKRLSYQKGQPVADHEDVLIAVRQTRC